MYSTETQKYFSFLIFGTLQQFKRCNRKKNNMSAQIAYNQIISRISKIYQAYEEKANRLKEENNKKSGSIIDKQEKLLIQKLEKSLEPNIAKLVNQMDKSKGVTAEMADFTRIVRDSHGDIKTILKKRSFNFKVNKQITKLSDDTNDIIQAIRKDLKNAGQTKFLCCGTDGSKALKNTMNIFKIHAGKWRLLTMLESKDSIENFTSPDYNQKDFKFISQILAKSWPKNQTLPAETKYVEVQKPVKVEVVKYIDKGGILSVANQYIFSINREQNPAHGLEIYRQQADKNDPNACAYLGKVFQEGILVPKDLAKAVKYYKKAMDSNHSYAIYRYSMCLIRGQLNKNGQTKQGIQEGFKLLNQIISGDNPCPQALTDMGQIYEFGSFSQDKQCLFKIPKDLKKSIAFYKKARTLNSPRAANNLGLLYFNNKYLNQSNPNEQIQTEPNALQNCRKALNFLQESQKCGHPQAYYNLGIIYNKGLMGLKDQQKALHYFYEGGIKGDYQCKVKFAYQLMNQTSILKQQYEDHYHLAIHWLQSVIHKLTLNQSQQSTASSLNQILKEKGEALFYLGLIYQHGFGVQKSPKKAFNYFIQAAQTDFPAAKNKIGDCYFSGYGVKMDRQLAIGCYIQAAELSNSDAMVNLGTIYLNGIPGTVQRNYNKAHEYFCKAMDLQNSDAMIHLSYMYRNGLGLQNDEQLAKKLLEQAAKNKNATALYMLKQQGSQFNSRILFQNLQNEFFTSPKKLDIREIVPILDGIK